jgi:hypothetical protein
MTITSHSRKVKQMIYHKVNVDENDMLTSAFTEPEVKEGGQVSRFNTCPCVIIWLEVRTTLGRGPSTPNFLLAGRPFHFGIDKIFVDLWCTPPLTTTGH